MEKEMVMYDGKVFGVKVSDHALENGYLDYSTLSDILEGTILNNDLINFGEWELISGEDNDCMMYYIISRYGYKLLSEYTDEAVYYNDEFNVYLWGIDHYGTSWDYVLTDIKLVDGDQR